MTRLDILTVAAGGLAAFCVPAAAERIEGADLGDLPAADVVILGEYHDNPAHHAHQAWAVGALGARALVFEMLEEAQALRIKPDLLTSAPLLEAALQWEARGWPDFDMYFPIFAAADGVPVFGGALPDDVVRRAVSEGAATVLGDGAALFGLERDLPEAEQAEREAGQAEAHCDALPERMLPGMVEAQRLRDAGLARAVIAAHAEAGGPVLVIAGNGHARRDWGIPAALSAAAPDLQVISVGQLESDPGAAAPFDYWIITESVDRGDPCEAFAR